MTLAAASVFPLENLGGLPFRKPQVLDPNAIVFCTDSRLTLHPGGKKDMGNKVFQIGPGTGLVFSGNVSLANFAIDRLTQFLRPRPPSMRVPKLIDRFSRTFRKAHKIIEAKTPARVRHLLHTQYLVGYHNAATDRAILVEFSSPTYLPMVKKAPAVIGSTDAVRESYLQRVQAKVQDRLAAPASPIEMATVLLGTLQDTIDSRVDESIGGVPEAIIIDAAGVHIVQHVILGQDLQPEYHVVMEGEGWIKKTADGRVLSTTSIPPYSA